MKTVIVLKEFSDLPSEVVQVTPANAQASPELPPRRASDGARRFAARQVIRVEKTHDMLRAGKTTPPVNPISYHHWGLNE